VSAILRAEGLHKNFGAVTAAADVNLAFDDRDVVSLIGANGAGKTTFLNIVTGYVEPDRGRVTFHDRSLVGLSPRAITRLGVSRSFQIPQLFQSLSVRENLRVAEGIAGAAQQADAMVERFALGPYADHPGGSLPEGSR
jgi:branched-chain amino acid transport system ATP-binding protein